MRNKNIDKENLRQVILDFWKQFEAGFDLVKKNTPAGDFKSICVSGMGGSSLPADLLETYLFYLREKNPQENKPLRIIKNRGYQLPQEAYEDCLNIFISYSGNTEETLESLNSAIKKRLPSLGMAGGGKLIEICKKNKIPCLLIPKVSQPRYATGYFFASLLEIISNCGLIKKSSREDILGSVKKLKEVTLDLEKAGKKLAQKISRKTPVIHTTEKLRFVGRVGKIKINENAKTPCFYNYYPELNHNEMVGYSLPQAKFFVIALEDPDDHPRILKRMRLTNKLLTKKGVSCWLEKIPLNDNPFLKIFSSLALFDWISYYLALAYKQDPTPVQMVEKLKTSLTK